jgi:hypothetical protein
MTSRRAFLSALAALSLSASGLPTLVTAAEVPLPQPRPKTPPNPKAVSPTSAATSGPVKVGTYTHGRVIVLRGLYNFFSRGMDQIAADLRHRGVTVTLENHSRWQVLSAKLIDEYKANPKDVVPIILIGHSLGGDASLVMANWLAHNGVPVRFVAVFDAVAETHPIIGSVQEVLNYYKGNGYGQKVEPGPNFKGAIDNVDLSDRKDIDHLNIDKDPVLQGEVIARVMAILDGKAKAPPSG